MALLFGGAGTDRVDCGNNSSVNNLSAFTYLMWVYPTTLTTFRTIFDKRPNAGANLNRLWVPGTSTGALSLEVARATQDTWYRTTNMGFVNNAWQFAVATYDYNAAAGSLIHLYRGTLTSTVVEGSYDTVQDGSGARLADNSYTWLFGNDYSLAAPYIGRIACIGLWNRALSLLEIQEQQFHPHVTNGCIIFSHLGFNGTGTQPDLSGNGNNGTVTGTTVADHVPLGPPFGFDIRDGVDTTLAAIIKTIADTGNATDATPLIKVSMKIAESGMGTDATPHPGASLKITEGVTGTDVAIKYILILASDTIQGLDALKVAAGIKIAETGVGSEVIRLAASLKVTDVGSGADTPRITVLLKIPDAASVSDLVRVIQQAMKTVADSGAGSDVIRIGVKVFIAETFSAIDAISVIRETLKKITDGITGTDIIKSVTVSLKIPDSANLIDVVSRLAVYAKVLENVTGIDQIIHFDISARIVTIGFIIATRLLIFNLGYRKESHALMFRAENFGLAYRSIQAGGVKARSITGAVL